jgi:hypothetical protein
MLNKGIQAQGNETPPYTFSDEVTKKKIKRHLTDINDVITEKDIKNVKVPGVEDNVAPAEPAEKSAVPVTPEKKSKKKNKKPIVDESPGNPVTPWDVLNE